MNNINKKLEVNDLKVSFRTNQGKVHAVRGINFDVYEGETLAIVGESGSGKSVSSRAIMGILAGNAIIEGGSIIYENQDLTKISEEQFHKLRGNKIGMIFQDPMSSLNPIMRIGKQITEGILINGNRLKNKYDSLVHPFHMAVLNIKNDIKLLKKSELSSEEIAIKKSQLKDELKEAKATLKVERAKAKQEIKQMWLDEQARVNGEIEVIKEKLTKETNEERIKELNTEIETLKENLSRFKKVTKKEAKERAIKVMDEVGIPFPEKRYKQYPFQLSGGMRQRIVIAIALTTDPDILICDEPTTALDVTIQAQILDLIKRLKRERNLTVIFITHDLGVVANVADRIAVMYAGKVVEIGTTDEIFYNPKHPYTWALLSSVPDLDSKERLLAIPGTPPNMLFPPKGDAFAERNQYAMAIDFEEEPPFFKVSDTHYAATWLLHKNAPKVEMPKILQERIKQYSSTPEEVKDNE